MNIGGLFAFRGTGMTEAEWLTCDDPVAMLSFIRGRLTPRLDRLCACGSARLVWDQLADVRSRQAVEVAERFADCLCKLKDLHRARRNAVDAARNHPYLSLNYVAVSAACAAADKSAEPARPLNFASLHVARTTGEPDTWAVSHRAQAAVIRDIIPRPDRRPAFDTTWRTPSAVGVARRVYDERAFHDLPVLADALQDAGCDDAAVLDHCRAGGVHVRGCWVVDLVLGLR